jgi:hypothetical protein
VLDAELNFLSDGIDFKGGHRAKRGSLVSDTRFSSCDGKLKRKIKKYEGKNLLLTFFVPIIIFS